MKRNDTLILTTTWINLESMLSETVRPRHKSPCIIWFHFHETFNPVKIKSRLVVAKGRRQWGIRSDYLLGMVFPPRIIKMFWNQKKKMFWNQIAVIVAQHCKYAKCIELYFSMVKVTNYMLSVFYHICKRGLYIDLTHTQLGFFPVVDLSFLSSGNSFVRAWSFCSLGDV